MHLRALASQPALRVFDAPQRLGEIARGACGQSTPPTRLRRSPPSRRTPRRGRDSRSPSRVHAPNSEDSNQSCGGSIGLTTCTCSCRGRCCARAAPVPAIMSCRGAGARAPAAAQLQMQVRPLRDAVLPPDPGSPRPLHRAAHMGIPYVPVGLDQSAWIESRSQRRRVSCGWPSRFTLPLGW